MQTNDEDILIFNRIKNDDKEAFNVLFEKYYQNLCEFSFSIIADKSLAEEAVADVFANIWIKRRKLNVKSNVRSYLYAGAKNNTLSYLRKNKQRHINIESLMNFEAVDMSDPEKDIIIREKIDNYEQLLMSIPEKSRIVFKMHRFDNLKYREIAEILSVSIKTVEKHMGVAIKLMRKHKNNLDLFLLIMPLFIKIIWKILMLW